VKSVSSVNATSHYCSQYESGNLQCLLRSGGSGTLHLTQCVVLGHHILYLLNRPTQKISILTEDHSFSRKTHLRAVEHHLPCGTCHQIQVNVPFLNTAARQASTWSTYPRNLEGWFDLGTNYIPRWFRLICPQTVIHPSNRLLVTISYHLVVIWSKFEPQNSRLQVQHPTTAPPSYT